MDHATLLHVKSTILHSPPSIITRQRPSVDSKLLCRPRNVSYYTTYLNDNAQTPLNRFAVYMLYNQVSMFTHYEDVKGDEKCKILGGLGVRGHRRSSETCHLIERICLPIFGFIETMRLSCTYSSYSAFFVESGEFEPTHPAFVAPIGGDPVRNLQRELWCQKTRVKGRSCGIA